ncbi:MAG: hypothetical protein A2X36_16935 [Elusimicrobia bacterium GWA2_69_24]|nr:MAG: hypothetical protein A2X36_16935 [Elusimicrobia bacterium GWA2_69_24]HBL16117.1 hypothetical protein [Elusimicrobiota bacterium]
MKTLIILALAAVGAWYLMTQLQQNKEIRKTQEAAVEAAAGMKKSVEKARGAEEAANKAIQETAARVEEAVQDSRD